MARWDTTTIRTHTLMELFGTMLVHRSLYKIEASMIPAYNFLRERYGYWDIHENYDAVISWRTDDSYFNISQVFLSNGCDIEGLRYAMSRGNMREQVVLTHPNGFTILEAGSPILLGLGGMPSAL